MSELTEDQKRRIEQEERARLAEEAYRQEVRRNLASSPPLQAPIIQPIAHTGPGVNLRPLFVTLFIVGFLLVIWRSAVGYARARTTADGQPFSLVHAWQPVNEQIATGQFSVPPQSYKFWTITVPPGTRNFQLTGRYSAIGGSANDIAAVVATEEEFQNWINGHESRIFYASPGKVTTGEIDIKGLPPGRYVLAFSNKFSTFAAKAVAAEINIEYDRPK